MLPGERKIKRLTKAEIQRRAELKFQNPFSTDFRAISIRICAALTSPQQSHVKQKHFLADLEKILSRFARDGCAGGFTILLCLTAGLRFFELHQSKTGI